MSDYDYQVTIRANKKEFEEANKARKELGHTWSFILEKMFELIIASTKKK